MCRTTHTTTHSHTPALPHAPHLSPRPAITLIGGDARQLALGTYLSDLGYDIYALCQGEQIPSHFKTAESLASALKKSQFLVLPLPATRDGSHIFCPLDPANAYAFDDLKQEIQTLSSSIRIFGGLIPPTWKDDLQALGCHVTDYYAQEDVQLHNARITAEAAIMTAMELTSISLLDASIAVVGYGRIGQLLAQLLVAWGANVTVYARRQASLAMAACHGCNTCPTSLLATLTKGYNVIFNTVPERLIGNDILSVMPCDTLLIDLSSPPFGIDPDAAHDATTRCGLGVVFAPSLPGRYAPRSAGEVIAKFMIHVITAEERGDLP